MVDISSIQAAIGGLQAAGNIAKAAIDLRDANLLQNKVIELNRIIIAAQSSAIDAKAEQFDLLERIRSLEAELRGVKEWDAEKQRYKLTSFVPGAVAYVLKRSEANGEPGHALCANCYQKGFKSMLQSNGSGALYEHAYRCPACKFEIKTRGHETPEYAD
jgi:hypothetical protein